jgi:hypothetical protein
MPCEKQELVPVLAELDVLHCVVYIIYIARRVTGNNTEARVIIYCEIGIVTQLCGLKCDFEVFFVSSQERVQMEPHIIIIIIIIILRWTHRLRFKDAAVATYFQ